MTCQCSEGEHTRKNCWADAWDRVETNPVLCRYCMLRCYGFSGE